MPRLALAWLFVWSVPAAHSQECCDPASPFTLGEAQPDNPASCKTMGDWLDAAPDVGARVSMAIVGRLATVQWDGALAYLIMCEPSGIQVMCITYSTGSFEVGDVVMFAGGFGRAGVRRIVLDPCIASPE